MTSEALAKAMDTNPVVIRRVMAGLRDQGYVRSEKGHGGGWTLARDLATISLRDIYEALGQTVAVRGRQQNGGTRLPCRAGRECRAHPAFDDAEALLLSRLGDVTLAKLSADFHKRLVDRRKGHRLEIAHAS